MPTPDKIDQLYDALKADGAVSKSRENFRSYMLASGEQGYRNRKQLYDALKADGAVSSRNYEEFRDRLGLHAVGKAAPVVHPALQKTSGKPSQPTSATMTDAQKQQMVQGVSGLLDKTQQGMRQTTNRMKYAKGNTGLSVKPAKLGQNKKVVERAVFNPASGKMEKRYLTESGNEYDVRAFADSEQRHTDFMNRSVDEELQEAYSERDRLGAEIEELGNYYERGNPVAVPGSVSVRALRMRNDSDIAALQTAYNKTLERITTLEAERDDNGGTQFWRGFTDAGTSDTWLMGLPSLQDNGQLLRAKRKLERGEELTRSERAMLDATVMAADASARYGKNRGKMYEYGQMAMHSLPFMLQFIGTGGGLGLAMKAGKSAGDVAAGLTANALGKWMLKQTGRALGSVGGAVAEGALMANTIGAAGTAGDIIRRYVGDATVDENGAYIFEGGKSLPRSVYEGEVASSLEYGSEVLGGPIDKVLGKVAGRMGLSKLTGLYERVSSNTVGRAALKVLEKMQVHSLPGEILEEEAGMFGKAALGVDNNFSIDPKSKDFKQSLFNLENHLDVVFGIGLSMGLTSAAVTTGVGGVYGIGKVSDMVAYRRTKHAVDKADALASFRLTKDRWEELREKIDGTPNTDFKELGVQIATDESLDTEEKKAALEYMGQLVRLRGFNLGMESKARQNVQDKAAGNPSGVKDNAEEDAANAKYSAGYDANLDARMDIATGLRLSPDDTMLQAAWDGVIQRIEDDADIMAAVERERTEQMQHKTDGSLRPAILKEKDSEGNDQQVYIVDGNVQMMPDGSMVDKASSDNIVVVRNPVTGERKQIDPSADTGISSLGEVTTAEQREADIERSRQEYVQAQIDEAQGTVRFVPGQQLVLPTGEEAVVVATDADGENITVALGDGTQATVQRSELQRIRDEKAAADYRNRHGSLTPDPSPKGEGSEMPQYSLDDDVYLQTEDGEIHGNVIAEENPDGLITIQSEQPIGGRIVNQFTREQLDGMTGNNAVENIPPQVNISGENIPQEPVEAPVTPSEPTPTEQPTAEPMPVGEDGEEDWQATTPERAHAYIFNEAGLSRSEGNEFIAAQTQAAQSALAKAKSAPMPRVGTSIKKYNEAKAKRQEKIDEAQRVLDYWQQVRDIQNDIQRVENERRAAEDAVRHDEAVAEAQAEYEARKQAEAERKVVGNKNPMPAITEKWNNATKVDGHRDEIMLPDGTPLKGHYVLHESGASSPSHNPETWQKTDGFPMDANDNSVNDRDYERDHDAQEHTQSIARQYDQRALQSVPVVSNDGVVLSGNGRTMAGELAARDNTDGAYVNYLKEYAPKFGFTAEQVGAMQHPRVSFVPDEAMPYTAETFAKFNQQEMKSQNKTEQAVKLGKTVSDDSFKGIVRTINGYDTLGNFYNDAQASLGAIYDLHSAGVVPQAQLAEMVDGVRGQEKLSAVGREFLENILIGKAFESDPEVVRMLTEVPSMRQSVVYALGEIVDNAGLKNGYSLQDILPKSVRLVYDARMNGGAKFGDVVSVYARQGKLFADPDELQTVADFNDAAMLMLADVLNDSRVTMLKTTLQLYNRDARDASNGQADIFSGGGVKSREEVLRDVIKFINENYGRKEAIKKARAEAVERRKAESVQQDGTPPAVNSGSEDTGRNPHAQHGVSETDLVGKEFTLSDQAAGNGEHFYQDRNGNIDLVEISQEVFDAIDYKKAPLRLTPSMIEHMIGRHGKETGAKDVDKAVEFILDVMNNFDHVRLGYNGALIFSVENGRDKTGKRAISILLSSKTGDFYGIVSSGYEGVERLKKRPLLWAGSAVITPATDSATEPVTTLDAQQGGEQLGSASGQSGLSEGKMLWRTPKDATTASVEQQGLDYAQPSETETATKGSGITPQSTDMSPSEVKVSENPATVQEKNEKVAENQAPNDVQAALAAAEQETNTEPTEAQKEAGNYKKGHVKIDGYDVTIENPKGSVRSGVNGQTGQRWATTMQNTYGYIRGTEGVDGDHIDVFFSEDPSQGDVFVVDQVNKDGSFDEHKVMYGFPDIESARKAYLSNYEDGWQGLGAITPVSKEEFKKWIDSSHRKTKPFAEYSSVKPLGDTQLGEQPKEPTVKAGEDYVSAAERIARENEVKRTAAHFAEETQEEAAAFDKRVPEMDDEELLAYMREDGKGNINKAHHPSVYDEYDYRHGDEQLQSYDDTLVRLNESGTTLEQAEEMLANIQKDVSRLATEDRAMLLGQEEALLEYIAGLEKEYVLSDPRTMSDEEKERRGNLLRDTYALPVEKGLIISKEGVTARKAAENWWVRNVGAPRLYETEAGVVVINLASVDDSLAHGYSQAKLDAITSLPDGFSNAVYLGSMEDADRRATMDHYFAYPIDYDGKRRYVFCRALHDNNTNRLYVHEVFVADSIKKGNTLQTAASKPHGGIALYRDILANVLKQAEREGGHILILPSDNSKEAGGLSSRTLDLSSIVKGSDLFGNEQRKVKKSSSEMKIDDVGDTQLGEQPTADYSIEPTTYTNKKGKTTPMHLVTFGRELSKDEIRAGKELAKESRGWWDREKSGFMMRDEDSAKALAEALSNEEAVQDAQPLSVEDVATVTDQADMKANADEVQDALPEPKKVNVESLMGELGRKGEAKLSDHTEEQQQEESTEQPKQEEQKAKSKWVDDADAERFEELRRRLRQKLGGQLNMGVDPEAFALGVEMSYLMLKHGARKFAEFAKQMIEALGENVRPYLKSFYNGARDLPEMAEYEKELTPYDEVRTFDVMNFDKEGAKDIVATAEHIVREQAAEREAKEATDKLKQERNEQRKETEQEVAANTEALASEAAAVASEVESKLPSARSEREVNDLAKNIDDAIDKVNDQLALLGYYEAEPVASDFNEAYGYMRNAEKKAVRNVTELFKTLTKELGISDPVVYDAKGKKQKSVTANIAPAGGDVTMRFMLNRDKGVELYIDFMLEPDYENNRDNLVLKGIMFRPERNLPNGGRDYLRANNFFPVDVTMPQMLQGIRSVCQEWLPAEDYVAMAQRIAAGNQQEKPSKERKSKKKSVSLREQTIPDLFSGLFSEEDNLKNESNDTARTRQAENRGREDGTVGRVPADRDRVLDTNGTEQTDYGRTASVSDTSGSVVDATRTGIPGQRSSRSATRGNNVAGETERGLSDGGRSLRNGETSSERRTDDRGTSAETGSIPSRAGEAEGGGKRGLAQLRGRGNVKQPKKPEPKFKRNYLYPENSSEIDNMTPQQRLTANVEALEVVRALMKEGREATPEEREILGKYRGWGGVELGRAYSTDMMRRSFTDRWGTPTEQGKLLSRLADVIDELDPNGERGLLSAINRAALTSYYTPTGIARAMNRFAELAGFKGGTMLDPSMGNGVFEGTMSKAVQQRTMIHGVELDWLTGQIARNLYPDANVLVTGYEQAGTADNAYDVVISNIPFGDISVTDKSWKHDSSPVRKAAQNRIHNYFAVKMLDNTRPGGLCVIMTSNAILDTKGNQIIREHLADQAEILGVVRLPDNTFKGAGTSVVTDVIFLRKYKDDADRAAKRNDESYTSKIEKPFLSSSEMELVNPTDGKSYKVALNGYFTANKGMMIGDAKAGGQYRADQFGLGSNMSTDELAAAMQKLVEKKIVGDRKGRLFDTHKTVREVKQAVSEAYKGDGSYISSGNIVEQDGMIGIVTSTKNKYGDVTSTFTEMPALKAKASRIRAMLPIRATMKELIAGEIGGAKESVLSELRQRLQKSYDDFVKQYGRLNDKANDFLTEDVDGYQLRALERYDDDKFVGLSDIFTKNTIKPALDLSTAKTPADAISLSLAEYGEINPSFMEDVLGESWAEQCGETLFRTPFTEDVYETADAYLSGDVKTKLEQAREAAKQDKTFEHNVKALEAVQPEDIPFEDISIRMGARWIPAEVYTDFMYDMFGIRKNEWKGNKSGVEYMPEVDQYVVNVANNELGGEADAWRTSRRAASEVFTAALQDKSLSVYDTIKENGKEIKVLNKEETELLNNKIQDLRTAFEDWLSQNPEREEMLMRLYNDKFNRTVLRKFDGSHLNVAGLMGKELRPHQKDAVWMLINNRGGIVDHIVGAGKTLVMQSAIMEMRRMGIAKKPMIIGLKATVAQIAKEFREAYPAARILAPTEKDFEKKNRKKLLAKIAVNDYDCIIISHDNYTQLDHTEEVERGVIDEQMMQLDAAIEYLYGQSDKSQLTKKQIKGLEKRKANLEAKLDKLLDRKIDREFTFEGLGVDYLFVDECQHFKSLPYVSTYDRVAGLGDKQGSQRAIALLNGVRYLQRMHQGDRGTVFLSGTTISNSLSEIYHLLNYLRPSEMERLGMTTFDAWAGNYAIHTAELEYGVTNELKEKDRFRSLTNIPELSKMYAEIADVRNDMNLKLPKPKMRSHVVTVPQSDIMQEINREIVNMVKNKDGSYFGIDSKDTTPWGLLASTLSAKAAINPRLIDEAYDSEGGKIPAVCENVKKIYDQFAEQKGTQLIFCDTGVPGKGKKYDAYSDIINRLVNDYGIPRKEIADIHEANTNEKRKALFAKVNDGSVRILIGGTKNMGTGVNVQKRIVAMHHVDVPWTPADREQREGRGVRQGNEIARDFNDDNVDVYFYATEGSLDMYKYQLQETKGKLFAQFKSGTIGDRTFDEGDAEGDFDPAEVVAMLSGNPVIFEKSKQDKKVEKLRRAKRAYESDWQRRRSRYEELQTKKRNFERLISLNASDVRELERGGFIPDSEGKYPTAVTVQVKDDYASRRTFDKPKEAGEYIHSLLKQGKKVQLSGFNQKANITVPITDAGLFGKPVAELDSYGGIKYTVEVSDDDTAAGVAFRNLLQKVYSNKKVYERNLEEVNNQLNGADPGENKFPKQAELDEALKEKKRLDDEYKKLSDEEPKADENKDGGLRFRDNDARDVAQSMDDNNGTEVVRFIDFLRRGRLEQGESRYFHVGETGDILNEYGISGKITIGTSAVNSHHNEDADHLDENDWVEVIEKINEPVAITEYGDKGNSYRIYTIVEKNGKNICVGVDVNSVGRDVNITNIRTAFARDIANALNERLVYPHSRTELETAIRELSLRHNREVYPEQPFDTTNIRNNPETQTQNEENLLLGRDGEDELPKQSTRVYSAKERREREAYAERQWRRAHEVANEIIDKLNISDDITVYESIDEVPGSAKFSAKRRMAKGWYDPITDKIVVVLGNHRSPNDVKQTILHEAVAHYGLRKLFGKNFETFLDNVYKHADMEVRRRIISMAANKGWDIREATEEYLASLAEDTDFDNAERRSWAAGHWFNKIKQLFLDMLHHIGLRDYDGGSLTDNELRYILWRSYKNLAEPGHYRNYFSIAEDTVMQSNLHVGYFTEETGQTIEQSTKVAESGLMFRDGDFSPRDRSIARDTYERMVSTGGYQFQEAVQDSMLGLKRLYQSILGKGTRMEDVDGFENAYSAENRMTSATAAQQYEYYVRYMKPLLKAISDIAGANNGKRQELTDYMMAKHGLERNMVMAQRDFDAYQRQYPSGTKTLDDFRERDYAGLTALTGEDDVAMAELTAQQMVDNYEQDNDTTELWKRVNDATAATLAKIYSSGLLSKERYEQIQKMFEYYIPLQGWDETTSDEVYGYLTSKNGPLGGSPIKHAKGRSSKADDPIATIALMADDAIRQGNRNKMKQTFLNFVLNHQSDLVSVNDLWLQYNAAMDEWEPVFADIENSDTAADVARKVEAFEERMQQLAESDPDNYKRGRDAQNIPYKVVKGNLKEHQVLVRRNGRTYVLTINGNPRAAQALNGLTNPDVETGGVVGNLMQGAQWINRNLSAFYTTRNPDFVASNFFRDMLYSNCMTWVKESPKYAVRFHKNFGRMNPARMRILFGKWEDGTLDESNYIERLFKLFMLNGGETGYTNIKDIEGHKREIAAELKRNSSNARKAWQWLGEQLDLLNRSVENCARFAAFVTSREEGRSIERSIYDAKEISVNFNKKGSGGKMVNATGQTLLGKVGSYVGGGGRLLYVFWNAGVQGTTNFARAAKRNPIKATVGAASMFMLGAVIPLLAQAMGGGDDDDKNAYYNLPEYVRRSNIIINAGNQWIAIPLPIEFRAFYGLGELATGVITGNERYSDSELAFQMGSQISQILPLDMLEGGGGINPFIPSIAKPFVEAYIMNKSWTGLPVYKDSPWNKNNPEWTKAYKSANTYLVSGAKWLNDISGGDDYKKGFIDINPAKVEYLLSGMLGGAFTTVDKLVNMGETIFSDREFDWRNILIANRVVKTGDERTANRKLSNEYFKYKDEYEETKRLLKKYSDEAATNERYKHRLERLQQSEEYLLYDVFDNYQPILKSLHDAKDGADEATLKSIENEENALRRDMVDLMHAIEDDMKPDINAHVDAMLKREFEAGGRTQKPAGSRIAKRLGGTDSYGSPQNEYGQVYLQMRDYIDLVEDVMLQIALKKAKDSGDTDRAKDIESARRQITEVKKDLAEVPYTLSDGTKVTAKDIMLELRDLRKNLLSELGITTQQQPNR